MTTPEKLSDLKHKAEMLSHHRRIDGEFETLLGKPLNEWGEEILSLLKDLEERQAAIDDLWFEMEFYADETTYTKVTSELVFEHTYITGHPIDDDKGARARAVIEKWVKK